MRPILKRVFIILIVLVGVVLVYRTGRDFFTLLRESRIRKICMEVPEDQYTPCLERHGSTLIQNRREMPAPTTVIPVDSPAAVISR